MREILFKAKDLKGNWKQGFLFKRSKKATAIEFITIGKNIGSEFYIQTLSNECDVDVLLEYKIIPETISQYINCIDWRGEKIFEGDEVIIERNKGDKPAIKAKVVYETQGACYHFNYIDEEGKNRYITPMNCAQFGDSNDYIKLTNVEVVKR